MKSLNTKKQKKIAFVVSRFPSFSETPVLNQIIGFINEGWDVSIYSQKSEGWKCVHNDINKYKLKKITKAYAYSFTNKSVIRCLAAVRLLSMFLWHPKKVVRLIKLSINERKAFSYSNFFLSLEILRSGADIVFSQFGINGVNAVLTKRLLPEIKLVVMFRGYDTRLPDADAKNIYRELFFFADIVFANSSYTYKRLLDFGSPIEKTIVQYNGIDTAKMSRKSVSQNNESKEIQVLSVCRLVEVKGLSDGITAFAEVARKSPIKVLYYIVGEGPLMDDLKSQVVSLGIENSVVFWGKKTQEEVIEFYKQADIFFLPSIAEAFGLVLLEAQSMQLPVVCTNAGGILDAVIDNQTACVVSACDTQAMAEKLLYLIKHPDARKSIGSAGREFVKQKFELTKVSKNLAQLMDSIRGRV